MLAQIKLCTTTPSFRDVRPSDYVLAPEKPVKRRRAGRKAADSITELDDSYEPLAVSEDEAS
jgi:hypothetical protein